VKAKSVFVGQEGQFYLMYQLAKRGIHAASTQGNAPFIDVLASVADGSKSIAIQVKTASWALRWRGHGKQKVAHHLEFPLGYSAAVTAYPDLIIAFIDLRKCEYLTIPDIYFVPSSWIKDYCASWIQNAKMVRWHVSLKEAEEFKNNWDLLGDLLAMERACAVESSPEDKVEMHSSSEEGDGESPDGR
jgi:hypothetical protein